MTPLEHARAILRTLVDEVSAGDVPTPHVVGVGAAAIACPETRVTLLSASLDVNPANSWACDVVTVANYVVTVARDCARTFNEDGTEDYASLQRVSERVDADVVYLGRLFDAITLPAGATELVVSETSAIGWGSTRVGTIAIDVSGALAITSLSLTVGVP